MGNNYGYGGGCNTGFGGLFGQGSNCTCSLPMLIILILIILQFSKNNVFGRYSKNYDEDYDQD
jgi:uncharacterized membrane protein